MGLRPFHPYVEELPTPDLQPTLDTLDEDISLEEVSDIRIRYQKNSKTVAEAVEVNIEHSLLSRM
jgi:hypothetical protein